MENVLITLSNISCEFSGKKLFHDLSLTINNKDKIALIGPNGVGKSSLLKIITGVYEPESGCVKREEHLKISYLAQHTVFDEHTPFEVLYEVAKLNKLRNNPENLASKYLTQNNFEPDVDVEKLSGGQKKKLALLRAMILEPDIILFDEPTNHLDFEGINFLESYLKSFNTTWILTTHDRTLLETCPTKIIEIDSCYKDNFFSIDGNYQKFLEQKSLYLQSMENRKDAIKSILRKENDWLSRMPKARGTKAKYRIDNAYNLQDELKDTEKLLSKKKINFEIQGTDRKTKEFVKIKDITFSFHLKKIVENLSFLVRPKDCIGILGNNGEGKTTLLKLIMEDFKPQNGEIRYAQNLKIKLFSQLRDEIPLDYTLSKALSPSSDAVVYQGQTIHIIPWAKKFLFSPAQLDKPLSSLSGGERARVFIARIIIEEADLLVLDEPTNDLDIATIEVLEDAIINFKGAVLLVTHDRKLIDNLCNFCLGFLGDGKVLPFADYNQWEKALKDAKKDKKINNNNDKKIFKNSENDKKKKLTFAEKKEFENIEKDIEEKETTLNELKKLLEDENVASDYEKLLESSREIEKLENKINILYQRWEELESKK